MTNEQQPVHLTSIAGAIEAADPASWVPVTFDTCERVDGPFFHGTKSDFAIGDELVAGHRSNYHDGRVANHIYFAALLEPAIWGAELAVALSDGRARARIYIVEPTGPIEDDPNLTDRKFPGNPTRSYRTRAPLRVIGELAEWKGHAPAQLQAMKDGLARLAEQGIEAIEE